MVNLIGVNNQNAVNVNSVGFTAKTKEYKRSMCENKDTLMYDEGRKHPITTGLKIQGNRLANAFTKYPKKGIEGSKNANFYEFLTMGMVPYLTGSATMIAVFNLASKFFDNEAAESASTLGKKMGLGVVLYGAAKILSKKLIEKPLKFRYGIDVNLPYKKVINELPEEGNKNNLVAHEYHKAFESVDFPRWDLLYDNDSFGESRNAYFEKIGKKLGLDENDLEHADQKVKPIIKEKVIKARLFSTLSSYFWAATGVGIAMQKPWENMQFNPVKRIAALKNHKQVVKNGVNTARYTTFAEDFVKKFVKSCKEFVNGGSAGKVLLGTAVGLTLLGNFSTLFDFNKYRGSKTHASTSLIDESKEKVVC